MNTAITANNIKLKRAYEHPAPDDGIRILIDRLWLRGVKRAEAAIDHWIKDVAPSAELRRWFAHDPTRWQQFQHRYRQELKGHRKKSMNCEVWRNTVRSHSFSPHTMKITFKQSCCAIFYSKQERLAQSRLVTADRLNFNSSLRVRLTVWMTLPSIWLSTPSGLMIWPQSWRT